MLPTPDTRHVPFERVYEPAEDSYLLLDSLASESESRFLLDRFCNFKSVPLVVEVGTGSGVVLAFVASNTEKIFGRRDVLFAGTDVNSFACLAARETAQNAVKDYTDPHGQGIFLDTIRVDLTQSFRKGGIDVLIFNPPYVPTEDLPDISDLSSSRTPAHNSQTTFEQDTFLLSLSYSGGRDGMETTSRLLSQLPDILNPTTGVAYILLCAQNNPARVMQDIKTWGPGWSVATVGHSGRTGGWEKLQILRIFRE